MMQSGMFSDRMSIIKYDQVEDGFGGWNNVKIVQLKFWCDKNEVEVDVINRSGKRELIVQQEIMMRRKASNNMNIGDIIMINNETEDYRINQIIQVDDDFFTKIIATKA